MRHGCLLRADDPDAGSDRHPVMSAMVRWMGDVERVGSCTGANMCWRRTPRRMGLPPQKTRHAATFEQNHRVWCCGSVADANATPIAMILMEITARVAALRQNSGGQGAVESRCHHTPTPGPIQCDPRGSRGEGGWQDISSVCRLQNRLHFHVLEHEITQPVIVVEADVGERVRTGEREVAVGI